MKNEIEELEAIAKRLKNLSSLKEKNAFLESLPSVQSFIQKKSWIEKLLPKIKLRDRLLLQALMATGQAQHLLSHKGKVKDLLKALLPIEEFYDVLGGVVGYHATVLRLLTTSQDKRTKGWQLHVPQMIDISRPNHPDIRQAILSGICHLDQIAEIYPVGGAADRLGLKDEQTGDFLPAAKLKFFGKTLLEHLIRDLEAREYLYYKLFNKQLTTPIAMMTSDEKDNHAKILEICEENHWFGRPKESFRFFVQPLVPALDKSGSWCLQSPSQLLLKPGGHGVIWKLASQAKVFDWFKDLGRKKGIVRQINNPMAGMDYGLLAFAGIGFAQNKSFGFASCPRLAKSSEGIDVLMEKKEGKQSRVLLTNIEYCDFAKLGIDDEPISSSNLYSRFPANTNLLFVDFAAIKRAIRKHPLPGMLINAKRMKYYDPKSGGEEGEILRLESTMQNIADAFVESGISTKKQKEYKTFITHHHRHKTISAIKREWHPEYSFVDTPEKCAFDFLKNRYELLTDYCGFTLPEMPSEEGFLQEGPSFIFDYHPALGPLYSIIAQKLRRGRLSKRSELSINLSELDSEGLDIEGSLCICSPAITGHLSERGKLCFSNQSGKCTLRDIKIRNKGCRKISAASFWKNEIVRQECCEILIEEGGEFEAEGLTLSGPLVIQVPKNTKVRAYLKKGQLKLEKTLLSQPTWQWHFSIGSNKTIELLRT